MATAFKLSGQKVLEIKHLTQSSAASFRKNKTA